MVIPSRPIPRTNPGYRQRLLWRQLRRGRRGASGLQSVHDSEEEAVPAHEAREGTAPYPGGGPPGIIADVKHIRDRAFIVTRSKLGLRASEMANIRICELNITSSEVEKHYPNMGSSPRIARLNNAVYIPHNRQGNKSKRPRVLPVDEELRRLWRNYLLIRPCRERLVTMPRCRAV